MNPLIYSGFCSSLGEREVKFIHYLLACSFRCTFTINFVAVVINIISIVLTM